MERKLIPVSNLLLDLQNYRIGSQDSQRDAIRAIISEQDDKLAQLAEDIIDLGVSPIELFMAKKEDSESNRYTIIEGNRRLAAIKLLLSPQLATGTDLEAKIAKLSKRDLSKVPTKVECIVVKGNAGAPWIRRRHYRGLNGIGLEDWSPTAKDRADADAGKRVPAKDVREFVLANANLPADVQEKVESTNFKVTNLTRLLDDAHIKDVLDLSFEDTSLVSKASQPWLLDVLGRMVTAVATEEFEGQPFKVDKIFRSEQRRKFLDRILEDTPKPKGQSKTWKVSRNTTVRAVKSAQSARQPSRSTPSTTSRSTVIPSRFGVKIPDGKINNIYAELKTLKVEKFANAAGVLLRVLLEFSVEHYVVTKNISLPKKKDGRVDDSLISKLRAVSKYMVDNAVMTNKELKPLNDSLSRRSSPLSTETLNAYVHNPHYNPRPDELKRSWDDLHPFFRKLWSQ